MFKEYLLQPTTTLVAPKQPHLIKPITDLSNIGIVLLQQQTLDDIKEKSGPLTASNEYQAHYWALVCRIHQPDKSVIDICLPTVFFNYKQIVSGAHIDFELQDVCDMSDKVESVHNMMVNKYMNSPFIIELQKLLSAYHIEFISTDVNSFHKHP